MADKRIKVEVVKADIERAKDDPDHCPIARALARQFHCLLRHVSVGNAEAEIYTDAHDVSLSLPLKARRFTEHFDENKQVAPFSFSAKAEVVDLCD